MREFFAVSAELHRPISGSRASVMLPERFADDQAWRVIYGDEWALEHHIAACLWLDEESHIRWMDEEAGENDWHLECLKFYDTEDEVNERFTLLEVL